MEKSKPFCDELKLQDAYGYAKLLADDEAGIERGNMTMSEINKRAIVLAKEAGYTGPLYTRESRKERGKLLVFALDEFGKQHGVDAYSGTFFDKNGRLEWEPGYEKPALGEVFPQPVIRAASLRSA